MLTVALYNLVTGDAAVRECSDLSHAMITLSEIVAGASEPGLTATIEDENYDLIAYFEFKGGQPCAAG